MTIQIVFETHSTTEDNKNGIATGWLPGLLSEAGRTQAAELGARRATDAIAGGESWRQAVARVASFAADLAERWSGRRVLVIGHVATRWGLDHLLLGTPLEDLPAQDFNWQPGWAYTAS